MSTPTARDKTARDVLMLITSTSLDDSRAEAVGLSGLHLNTDFGTIGKTT